MLKGLSETEKVVLSWAARLIQGFIVILIMVVAYFTSGLIDDTRALSQTLNETNRDMVERMTIFNEKITDSIHDLDTRLSVLEDRNERDQENK